MARYAIEIIGVRYLPEYPTDGEVLESFLALKFDVYTLLLILNIRYQ
jgi:hypothetical protein